MSIKARLTTGGVVELKKDCSCLDEIHTGPHWLHMDDFRRRRNVELVEKATQGIVQDRIALMQRKALLNCAAQFETVRLEEKEREMVRAGIEEIIR